MKGIACPHCTFVNPAGRVKCSMCLRLLRKRDRSEKVSVPAKAKKLRDKGKSGATRSTTSSPSESTPKSDAEEMQSSLGTSEESHAESEAPATRPTPPPTPTPPPPSLPPETAVVPTLFFTASGKAVSVRRESLLKAAERLEGPSDSPPPPRLPPSSSPSPSAESRVSTLFETASGKRVTVKADSIEKAKAVLSSLDEATAEPPRTMSTLFATAAGTAVRVSEAALQRAREKLLDEDGVAGEERAAPSEVSRASDDATTEEETSARQTGALHSVRQPGAPLASLSAGRRRGFVPPQQRLTLDPAARPVATRPAPVLVPTSLRSTRLEPLRFTPLFSSSSSPLSISPAPSLVAVMSEDFAFSAAECGSTLALLLGVREGQMVRVAQWHACMLKLGASARHCTIEWCRHALLSAMGRMACASHALSSSSSSPSSSVFSAEAVLLCLMETYNTEMVNGERPALRKMVEGDIPGASLVVLYLSSVREERSTPHMRIVTLSDGVYHMKATCDVPLSNLIRENVLRPGQKLAVCGAKLLLHGQCSPTECDTQTVLAVNYNCVRAVATRVPLGVCRGEPQPLPLALVHPLGGLVPAIEGVVARVLPSFYITQEQESVAPAEDGSRPARDRAIRAVRSRHAQLQASDRLHREAEVDGGAAQAKSLSRVTSLLLVKDGAEALVQQWETVEEQSLLVEDDGGMSLPTEGSWVTLYAVNPARSRTAAAPFSRAKLFFSSRKLHFVPSRRPLEHLRQVWGTAAEKSATVCVGDAVDVCGLFMGHLKSNDGSFVLLLLRDDFYAVLQIPVPSTGRVLSFPIPTTELSPLLILNSTFVTTEDSVAGSDCCRLFANEYTVVLQRSTQGNLKEALAQAASLRTVVAAAPQRHVARKAEIFRCLEEGEASPSSAGGVSSPSYAQSSATMSAEMPLDSGTNEVVGGITSSGPSFASSASREGRLPYYLRQGSGSGAGGRKLQGVFIPSPTTANTPARAAPIVQPAPAPMATSRAGNSGLGRCPWLYGNLSDLMFAYDPRLLRRPWHPLDDALLKDDATPPPPPPPSTARGAEFAYAQLCWTVSADSADDLTCKVVERRRLHDVMEAVCPLHELCARIADAQHIDVSLRRSATLARWRKEGQDSGWWRVFTASRELGTAAELDDSSNAYLWWLPGEWEEATKMLRDRMRTAFFFVSLNGDSLRHARLISDSCDVRELPYN